MASDKLTTSTSKSMAFRGTHNFKIRDFSYLKGMGVGKYIASDAFSVGGHLWEIQFYPDGDSDEKNREDSWEDDSDEESRDVYVSLYVKLVSKWENDLTVWFEYYLLDQNGNRWLADNTTPFFKMVMNKRYMHGPETINAASDNRGYDEFYKRSELEKSQFIKDDCFTIQCSVSVAKTSMDDPQSMAHPLPLSDLKESLEQLLETGEGSDVSFEVDGEIFNAHKPILSTRSPVFKSQFFGPLKDDSTRCIKIEEMQAPIFKALLRFIYCDAIPDVDSDCVGTIMVQHLLAAADRYGIQTLKSICESRLCENITIDIAASTLALAEQHNCFQLKSRCLLFIGLPENLEGVMQTVGFKNLSESCPATMCELLRSVARRRDISYEDANAKRVKFTKFL